MTRYFAFALLICSLSFLQTGCAVVDAGKQFAEFNRNALKLRPTDYEDPTEDSAEEWAQVGQDGRGHQKKEKEIDRWWWNLVMSEKARSIERNLGFE